MFPAFFVYVIRRYTNKRHVQLLRRFFLVLLVFVLLYGAVMVTEGLDIFKAPVPPKLVGKTVAETRIRPDTGCTVIAVDAEGTLSINPAATWLLPAQAEMILIGTSEAEERFLHLYGKT